MFPFAAAIFISAFLLFQVQPLISKVILPWFGGAANVWTTCMLFFQVVLLAGYAYAHVLKQYKLGTQAKVHACLVALGLVFCYVIPGDRWKPSAEGNPTVEILKLLTVTVGVPYFILSTTGPLLQSWFAAAHPGRSPYRLYSLSNIGSLLALLSFPVYFEIRFGRNTLGAIWAWGFVAFAALAGWLAWRMLSTPDPEALPPANRELAAAADDEPGFADVLLWLLLPMAASALLLSGTSQLMLDVAVVPFLYITPLAFYLLSFIICFDNETWYTRLPWGAAFLAMVGPALATMAEGVSADIGKQIVVYNLIVFFGCMACHGELAKLKPAPRHLTAFFLMVSFGGAVGGFFCGILAPQMFVTYKEFPIALALATLLYIAAALRVAKRDVKASDGMVGAYLAAGMGLLVGAAAMREDPFWLTVAAIGVALAVVGWVGRERTPGLLAITAGVAGVCIATGSDLGKLLDSQAGVQWRGRNFFGALVVRKYQATDAEDKHYSLSHGRIEHGMQFIDPAKKRFHTSYYGGESGLGLAINRHPRTVATLDEKGQPKPGALRRLRVGTIGLGTGTTATFCRKGDYFCFYDINPLVVELTTKGKFFTHLSDAPEHVPVFLGDARIAMERQLTASPPQKQEFDVLAVDAFSGDAIPTHLVTKECVQVYLDHFRNANEGILALHISNRYLRLERICRALAREYRMEAIKINNDKDKDEGVSSSTWVLVTKNQQFLKDPKVIAATDAWNRKSDTPLKTVWTDDYCNLMGVIDGESVRDEWPKSAKWWDFAAGIFGGDEDDEDKKEEKNNDGE